MSNIKTTKSSANKALLETLSREDLAATAIALGLPVKAKTSKTAIVAALVKAGDEGKAHFKNLFSISFKPEGGTRTKFLEVDFRNYISGPGEGNKVWLSPVASAPVATK